jgi:hypothetical protein
LTPQAPLQQAALLPLQMFPEVMQHFPLAPQVLYLQQSPTLVQGPPVIVQHVEVVPKPSNPHLRPGQQPE